MTPLTIARQFRGPPSSGNGGYTCGLVASHIHGIAEVTLRAPPPLDQPMELTGDAPLTLRHSELVVAEGQARTLDLDIPAPVGFEAATECATRFAGAVRHAFPECFTCGPQRTEGDGLRIFTGPVPARAGQVAAPWIPHESFADADGTVLPEIVWAALDCPGYFAAAEGEPALLGRMAARLDAPVRAGEPLVVMGWRIDRSGRKRIAGTALFDAAGALRGCALQTWISLGSEG